MVRRIVRASLTAVLLFYGASVASAQQATPDAEAPIFSLSEILAQALQSGPDAAGAARTLEQARLTYAQTVAQNGLAIGATGSVSHGDNDDLATADDSALGTNTAQAALTLTLPGTDVTLRASHSLDEARPTALDPSNEVTNQTSLGLDLSQTIWDGVGLGGGRARQDVRKAQLTLQTQTLADEATRKDISYRVTQAYHALLAAERTLDARAADLEQKTAELDRTRLLLEAGKASDLDRRQAEINLRSAQIEERAARNTVTTARVSLSALLGWERGKVYHVAEIEGGAAPVVDLETAVGQALQSRTDLKQLRLSRGTGEIDLLLTRSQASPQVKAGAGVGLSRDWTGKTTSADWNLSLSVSVPVLDSGKTRGEIQTAVLKNTGIDAQIADLEASIRAEVAVKAAAVQEATDRLDLSRLALDQAELRYDLAKTQEEAGTGSSLDVLVASADLTSARVAVLKSQSDLQLAILDYQRALGE